MALQAYRAVFQDGQIKLQEGDELIVTLLKSDTEQGISGQEILDSGIIGMWADRDDIGDSVELAEKIRREWESRM